MQIGGGYKENIGGNTSLFPGGNIKLAKLVIDLNLCSISCCLFRYSDVIRQHRNGGNLPRGGISTQARLRPAEGV